MTITMLAMCFFVLAVVTVLQAVAAGGDVISLSRHPQLFLDDYLVTKMTDLSRRMCQPVRHPANPLIVQDKPWEETLLSMFGTVLYDDAVGKYRCWYLAGKPDFRDKPDGIRLAKYFQCYAESDDGIEWTKPPVGQGQCGPYKEHNIVITASHSFCVLPTPDDPDPNKRYKGLGGRWLRCSPDGIRWDDDTPACMNWRKAVRKNDTSSCVVRWKDEYLAFMRYQGEEKYVEDRHCAVNWYGVMRCVGLSVSKDFVHWTPKRAVFRADRKDGYPWAQPYGLCVTPYGDVLIGLVPMLYLKPKRNNNAFGPMDVKMLVSRDGRSWHRVAKRGVFMDFGRDVPIHQRQWDMMVYPSTTMLVKDDKVHIYYMGSNLQHGEGKIKKFKQTHKMGIGLATLPADRFVALEPASPGKEGILQTRALTTDSGDLVVNAELADPADLKVELIDGAGNVLPGFDRNCCRLAVSDKLRYRVSWSSQEFPTTPGRQLALRFILRKGAFYAFQIA